WVDSRVGDAGLDIILKSLADPFGQCWIAGIKTSYFLLLCSPDSVTLRHPSLIATNERLSRYFRENGLHPEWLPYGLLHRSAFTLIGDRTAPVNSLDRPVLEFHMARLQRRGIRGFKRRLRGAMRVEEVAAAVGRGRWDPQHLSRHAEDLYGDSSITDRWVALLAEARRTRSRDGRDD
ncbi:MAG: spermine synthase, partial [Myxococcota bacterium]